MSLSCPACGVSEGFLHLKDCSKLRLLAQDYAKSLGGQNNNLPPPHNGKGYVLRTTPVRGVSEIDEFLRIMAGRMADRLRPREMTAADLGLTYPKKSDNSDAPYSFWLGDVERDERFYQKRLFNDGLLPLREPA